VRLGAFAGSSTQCHAGQCICLFMQGLHSIQVQASRSHSRLLPAGLLQGCCHPEPHSNGRKGRPCTQQLYSSDPASTNTIPQGSSYLQSSHQNQVSAGNSRIACANCGALPFATKEMLPSTVRYRARDSNRHPLAL